MEPLPLFFVFFFLLILTVPAPLQRRQFLFAGFLFLHSGQSLYLAIASSLINSFIFVAPAQVDCHLPIQEPQIFFKELKTKSPHFSELFMIIYF